MNTGIVSNISSEAHLKKELEALDLLEFFPVLVASGSVGYAKPARQIFNLAAKLVELKPREILFVGDDPERDYLGGFRAGLKAAVIDRDGRYKERTDMVRLSSLVEVSRLI